MRFGHPWPTVALFYYPQLMSTSEIHLRSMSRPPRLSPDASKMIVIFIELKGESKRLINELKFLSKRRHPFYGLGKPR